MTKFSTTKTHLIRNRVVEQYFTSCFIEGSSSSQANILSLPCTLSVKHLAEQELSKAIFWINLFWILKSVR